MAQNQGGVETTFTWDWAAAVPELLRAGDTLYLVGLDTLGRYESGAWHYYLPDALGSVRQEIDANGNVSTIQDWTPFGVAVSGEQSGLGYTGEWWDAAVGLQYLRARWYEPQTGRFTQVDPWPGYIRLPKSQYPYVYVWNNPVNLIDPTGLQTAPGDCGFSEVCHTGTLGSQVAAYEANLSVSISPYKSLEERLQREIQLGMFSPEEIGEMIQACEPIPLIAFFNRGDDGVILLYRTPFSVQGFLESTEAQGELDLVLGNVGVQLNRGVTFPIFNGAPKEYYYEAVAYGGIGLSMPFNGITIGSEVNLLEGGVVLNIDIDIFGGAINLQPGEISIGYAAPFPCIGSVICGMAVGVQPEGDMIFPRHVILTSRQYLISLGVDEFRGKFAVGETLSDWMIFRGHMINNQWISGLRKARTALQMRNIWYEEIPNQ